MFLQAFSAQFSFEKESQIVLRGSKFSTLTGSYVQSTALTTDQSLNVFNAAPQALLPLIVDSNTLQMSINATFGGQPVTSFRFGLNYPYMETFDDECEVGRSADAQRCSQFPVYATDYFNNTGYQAQTPYVVRTKVDPNTSNIDYSITANSYQSQICLMAELAIDNRCTSPNADFFSITNFDWPFMIGQKPQAGLIGLGGSSSVWLKNSDATFVGLKFTNLTDWTWSEFAPKKDSNFLIMYNETVTFTQSTSNTIIKNPYAVANYDQLSMFGFG